MLAPTGGLAAPAQGAKVRVGLVFFSSSGNTAMWPYPGFDTAGCERRVFTALQRGCAEVEFVPVSMSAVEDVHKAIALKDTVDGYLVYAVTLHGGLTRSLPDLVSMLMARILTGRGGYVSDPILDTSKNRVIYAHCMSLTKPFGSSGPAARFRVRSHHDRDPRSACVQTFFPEGYMATMFRTNFAQKKMVIHQGKAVGNLDSDRGCRTQLICEVRGDIEKLFHQWDQFGWRRVTVYGDVLAPMVEFGKALGLEIVQEA
jgi:hypothetical protein